MCKIPTDAQRVALRALGVHYVRSRDTDINGDLIDSMEWSLDDGSNDPVVERHESLTDACMIGILNFCGCGMPEETLNGALEGLQLLNSKSEEYEETKRREIEIFGSERSAYFFYYTMDGKGFLEHGGGVGASWLTQAGTVLRQILEIWKEMEGED